MGQTDNTLVFFLSDNGADASVMVRADGHDQSAAPGSAATFLCLGPGWATAANAPFRRHKVWMHEGGIATPMIVSWPSGIDRSQAGTLCRTPAHVIDLAPTILELAGVPWPERHAGWRRPPTPGRSLVPALRADVTIAREHLYWHHEENRALRVGDWKIVSERESGGVWELYNLAGDRIESKNLAAVEPERLRELTGLWERLDAQYHQDGATSRPAG
jgi:arylsulfatase A-like enzyme